MRFLFPFSARTPVVAPSTAVSVAAHAVMLGCVVYGTGARTAALDESDANQVYFLPPPDRAPNSNRAVEHLQFLDLGSGRVLAGRAKPDGTIPSVAAASEEPPAGGNAGREAESQAPAPMSNSPDSVFSVLDVEESVVRTAGSSAPAYPADLVKKGIEGGVFIRFVVDTSGHPDPASLQIVMATDSAFAQSVKDALPGMRFTPATVRGHHVRQAVEQNFQFKIQTPMPVNALKPSPTT